jgi:hypothetical protein
MPLAKLLPLDDRAAPAGLSKRYRFVLFTYLVILPLLLRALHGEKLKALCAEIEPHVRRSVKFFIAACRRGGID